MKATSRTIFRFPHLEVIDIEVAANGTSDVLSI